MHNRTQDIPEAAGTPSADCAMCPRLASFRKKNRRDFAGYFNGPVPSFGDPGAKLLIAGLAPGLHGANRTGRPFTGDHAGILLYNMLAKYGFSRGCYKAGSDDGLILQGALITNAVRCVPPENRPSAAEIRTCRPFLAGQIARLSRLRAIICLGRVSHHSTIAALGIRPKDAPFAHGAVHTSPQSGIRIFDSYHCSRYNTNTRRLTEKMFEDIFTAVRKHIDRP